MNVERGTAKVTTLRFGQGLCGVGEITTPFVALPAFYEARCEPGDRGATTLAIAPPRGGEARGDGPFDLDAPRLRATKLGLHVVDLQLAQADLIDIVARRATAP